MKLHVRRVDTGEIAESIDVGDTDDDISERRVFAVIMAKSRGMGPHYVVDDKEVVDERRRRADPAGRRAEDNRERFHFDA
jgi:hypothetical protein